GFHVSTAEHGPLAETARVYIHQGAGLSIQTRAAIDQCACVRYFICDNPFGKIIPVLPRKFDAETLRWAVLSAEYIRVYRLSSTLQVRAAETNSDWQDLFTSSHGAKRVAVVMIP